MVEGESGSLAIFPPWDRPRYEPSKRWLTWRNGAIATLYNADEAERRRGPQHDATWCELRQLALSRGVGHADARAAIRHRPTGRGHRDAAADQIGPSAARRSDGCGDAWLDLWNRANLAPVFLDQIIRKYEGTRLGRQELEDELPDDVPGDLWTCGIIEKARVWSLSADGMSEDSNRSLSRESRRPDRRRGEPRWRDARGDPAGDRSERVFRGGARLTR
jgi:hypothetical protein